MKKETAVAKAKAKVAWLDGNELLSPKMGSVFMFSNITNGRGLK